MDNRQVVQNFFGKPVRIFKATFKVDPHTRNFSQPHQKFTIETYGMPLPDFCSAVSYDQSHVMSLVYSYREAFQGLYCIESIPDKSGRLQPTVIMALEMVECLFFQLYTQDVSTHLPRTKMIRFWRQLLLTISLIRSRKLMFTHDPFTAFKAASPEYRDLLLMRSSREFALLVKARAETEGVTKETVYRRLRRMRGSNVINGKGLPRKVRGGS